MDGRWSSFSIFFDLVGKDLVHEVEGSRQNGYVLGNMNSTFIILIPKKDGPEYFNYYRMISLYNPIYKVITKVISNRINPILEKKISKE